MISWFKISYWLTILVPLAAVLVTPETLFPFIVGKYTVFRGLVDLALIIAALGMIFRLGEAEEFLTRLKNFFKSPLGLAITIFCAVFVLAGFLGVNPSFSFWSNFERGEGGLQMLHLYVWTLLMVGLFKERKDWYRLFSISAVAAGLMGGYGFLAGSGAADFIGARFTDPSFRFQGSIGNPAYVAAYLIFSLVWVLVLLRAKIVAKKLWEPAGIGLIALAGLFVWIFFLAQTRGAFLGLAAAVVVGLSYLGWHHKKLRPWFLGLAAAAILAVGSMIFFQNSELVKKLPVARIFQISFAEETLGTRLSLWKIAWEGAKERPLLGWGPENFIVVFDRKFDPNFFKPEIGFGAWYDRAHSIYFDALATTGFLGLVSLLTMWLVFFWQTIKSFILTPTEKALALSAAAAYLVQGLVLFDVLTIYLSVFILLAWVVAGNLEREEKKYD
jgi:O-antigen ligase